MTHEITCFFFFGLCPSSGILGSVKHNISETICFVPQVLEGRGMVETYSVGSLRKS
jgi:hypothetical protein